VSGVIHGEGPTAGGDYTMCGLALDAYESGDESEPVVMAAPGELITCKGCRAVIAYFKDFKGYRERPTSHGAGVSDA